MKRFLLLFSVLSLSLGLVFSQSGKSIEFNGQDQYMLIANHDDFNVSSSESFTVSAWFNFAEFKASYHARFIAKRIQGTAAADKSGWEFFGANSPDQFFAVNTPNAAGNHNNSVSTWATYDGAKTEEWVHLALVVDREAGIIHEYINGVSRASSAGKDITLWAANNESDVYVGCGTSQNGDQINVGYFFKGKIDNLRFYKRALSPAELLNDMDSEVTADTPGLVAAYDFENITGTTVPDITGNHPATLHNFPTEGNVKIKAVDVIQDNSLAGRGNDNEEILTLKISTTGSSSVSLKDLALSLDGTTDLNDIEEIKIYSTRSRTTFDPRNVSTNVDLLATVSPTSGDITIPLDGRLYSATNHLWVTFKVKDTAKEGNRLDASVLSISTVNDEVELENGNPDGYREIILGRKLLFAPGDDGAVSYRIPAITTADDGTLITLTDKRKNHSGDLPADIDILAKRSTDNGKTWSEPILVAQGTPNHGYGDAAIIKANSGKIVALFVGDNGLFQSNPSKLIRTYISTSDDNGLTWSEIRDITPQIYGPECSDPMRNKWEGLFFGSGHALSMRDGRIMAVVAVREPGMSGLQNYAVYSDDEGETWEVSERAIEGGDEAKVVELNDGTILMSSRKIGNRLWAKSTDRGETWGPRNSWTEIWGNNCDADIVRFTSTLDGYDKDRILHTLPNHSSRRNVSMWISYDEATTWPLKKTLCEGTSAYSSITILDDGTIGVYLEEDESKPYKMYFLNFSLEWLTDGADSFTAPGTEIVEAPEFSLEAGRYGENQTLSISSATEGASIYYTVDGSNPNKDALLYDGEITLDKSCTVKAIATKEGMANSVVVSANYIIGYVIPGQGRDVGADRYVTDITTTGGTTNINYTTSTVPDSYYIHHTESNVTVAKGESFKLNLTALPDQGDGLQWCQVIILVDWNGDFDFADSGERIAIIGDAEKDNKATVMNISQEITVPATALEGKRRIRVVYTDAWRPRSADLGEDPVDKGRMYDLDLVVTNNTSISDLSQLNVNIENPVKDKLYFELPTGKYNVNLTDLSGKSLFNTYTTGIVSNPMSNYPSQVYLLNVKDDNGKVYSQKLVKK